MKLYKPSEKNSLTYDTHTVKSWFFSNNFYLNQVSCNKFLDAESIQLSAIHLLCFQSNSRRVCFHWSSFKFGITDLCIKSVKRVFCNNYVPFLQDIISVDPCHKFTWCLDACIREKNVDIKRSRELQVGLQWRIYLLYVYPFFFSLFHNKVINIVWLLVEKGHFSDNSFSLLFIFVFYISGPTA